MKILMAYNIAVASTDGINVDKHFGGSDSFLIIKVNDDGTYENLGERLLNESESLTTNNIINNDTASCQGASCGQSCGGGHSDPAIQKKIQAILDCRCVLCNKCGPGSEKQLGKNNISVFEVDLNLEESLKKIIKYYQRSDKHQSLNGK
jgi:nitrogen fixation protein NifX